MMITKIYIAVHLPCGLCRSRNQLATGHNGLGILRRFGLKMVHRGVSAWELIRVWGLGLATETCHCKLVAFSDSGKVTGDFAAGLTSPLSTSKRLTARLVKGPVDAAAQGNQARLQALRPQGFGSSLVLHASLPEFRCSKTYRAEANTERTWRADR